MKRTAGGRGTRGRLPCSPRRAGADQLPPVCTTVAVDTSAGSVGAEPVSL